MKKISFENFENSFIGVMVFVVLLIALLVCAIRLGEEQPHRVTIDGKEYIRMKEHVGRGYQIILIPVCDSSKVISQ